MVSFGYLQGSADGLSSATATGSIGTLETISGSVTGSSDAAIVTYLYVNSEGKITAAVQNEGSITTSITFSSRIAV